LNTEIIPLNIPRGVSAITAKAPALFLPHAKAAARLHKPNCYGD
jgi:hypothetical protein